VARWSGSSRGRLPATLLDCPPSLGLLPLMALIAADRALVPAGRGQRAGRAGCRRPRARARRPGLMTTARVGRSLIEAAHPRRPRRPRRPRSRGVERVQLPACADGGSAR
jgi:hypothetical protein